MKTLVRKLSIAAAALIAAVCIVALVPNIGTASANSAIRFYEGNIPSGVIMTDRDCPVVVKREELFFNLPTVDPDDILVWSKPNVGAEYRNYVRATYTLHNPASYDVTATLAFPFGSTPYYFNENEHVDTDKYGVKLDDEPVDKKLRHTYIENGYYNYEFSAERDLARLRDDYAEDEFFNSDTVVYRHECYVHFDSIGVEYRLMTVNGFRFTADCQARNYLSNGSWHTGLYVESGQTFYLYTFGEDTENFGSEVKSVAFYKDGDTAELKYRDKTDGALFVKSTEKLTVDDLIYSNYDEDGEVSRMDWYNAVQDKIDLFCPTVPDEYISNYMFSVEKGELMRWYEYKITIESLATVKNEVTAPIYPDINAEFEPEIFTYRYLLSPATGWADFADLEIAIATPHYMIYSSVGSFDYRDGVYVAEFGSLPDGELTIQTCASKDPTHSVNIAWTVVGVIIILVIVGICVTFVGTIIAAIVLVVKYSSRNKQNR